MVGGGSAPLKGRFWPVSGRAGRFAHRFARFCTRFPVTRRLELARALLFPYLPRPLFVSVLMHFCPTPKGAWVLGSLEVTGGSLSMHIDAARRWQTRYCQTVVFNALRNCAVGNDVLPKGRLIVAAASRISGEGSLTFSFGRI